MNNNGANLPSAALPVFPPPLGNPRMIPTEWVNTIYNSLKIYYSESLISLPHQEGSHAEIFWIKTQARRLRLQARTTLAAAARM